VSSSILYTEEVMRVFCSCTRVGDYRSLCEVNAFVRLRSPKASPGEKINHSHLRGVNLFMVFLQPEDWQTNLRSFLCQIWYLVCYGFVNALA